VTEFASGDRRRALSALRDRLAAELDDPDADARVVAVVSKELRAVVQELDGLSGGEEVRPVDEIAAKRAKRLSDAAGL
jgi:hypothetical protein